MKNKNKYKDIFGLSSNLLKLQLKNDKMLNSRKIGFSQISIFLFSAGCLYVINYNLNKKLIKSKLRIENNNNLMIEIDAYETLKSIQDYYCKMSIKDEEDIIKIIILNLLVMSKNMEYSVFCLHNISKSLKKLSYTNKEEYLKIFSKRMDFFSNNRCVNLNKCDYDNILSIFDKFEANENLYKRLQFENINVLICFEILKFIFNRYNNSIDLNEELKIEANEHFKKVTNRQRLSFIKEILSTKEKKLSTLIREYKYNARKIIYGKDTNLFDYDEIKSIYNNKTHINDEEFTKFVLDLRKLL